MRSLRVHLVAVAALAVAASCSDEGGGKKRTPPDLGSASLHMTSSTGCLIDSDCVDGHFCFQGECSWECNAEAPCATGSSCSPRGRCLSDEKVNQVAEEGQAEGLEQDEEAAAAIPSQAGTIEVLTPPERTVEVDEGQPFVEVTLVTKTPVPEGVLLYRVQVDGAEQDAAAQQVLRSEGTDTFKFRIPTGNAALALADAKAQQNYLMTSVGGYSITLVPRIGASGLYAGGVQIDQFGGATIPLRFGLKVEPAGLSFHDPGVTARYLLLPISSQDVFTPSREGLDQNEGGVASAWLQRTLEWDAIAKVWFARFEQEFAVSPDSKVIPSGTTDKVYRALRVEIEKVEGKRATGALADRFKGFFDTRSADGVVTKGATSTSGVLTATRVGPLPEAARTPRLTANDETEPGLRAELGVEACDVEENGKMAIAALAEGAATAHPGSACAGVDSAAAFQGLSTEGRALCAVDLAEQALKGELIAKKVLEYLDPATAQNMPESFQEFLERCATEGGPCAPRAQVVCAEKALAHAYQQLQEADVNADVAAMMAHYQDVARESYLGRQLAAFQVDTNTRLEWLRKAEAPLFLANELKAYNEKILATWESKVLGAHFDVLALQFSPWALEVLGRATTNEAAASVRSELLMDQTQTWQGAMESLQIATRRWNELYQDDMNRLAKTRTVRTHLFDLYLSAATLAVLNTNGGSSASNAVIGSGFSALLTSLEELSLDFNQRIFMRDAEVVLNRSVDPSDSSQTIMSDRQQSALKAIADADASVTSVLAEIHATELNSKILTNRMITQVEELRSELVDLCGLPLGCSVSDITHGDLQNNNCMPTTLPGRCGFLVAPGSEEYGSFDDMRGLTNASEASQALLRIREAANLQQTAMEEFRANASRAEIEIASADGFATKMTQWDTMRRTAAAEVEKIVDEMLKAGGGAMKTELDGIAKMQEMRTAAYEEQKEAVANWSKLNHEGVESDIKHMRAMTALQTTSKWLAFGADRIETAGEIAADGLPDVVGLSNDVSFPVELAINMAAFAASTALQTAQLATETAAGIIELSMAEDQARREAKLSDLRDQAGLNAQLSQNKLAAIEGELRAATITADNEIKQREALIEALSRNLEMDLAYEKELFELRDRRDKVMMRFFEEPRLRVQVLRQGIVYLQRQQEYYQIVQRAQLLEGRYAALNSRLTNLNNLLASPTVIFAHANRLARAESRLDRAKGLLYDWVVALEYYAVRPFIDQRLAILLARNPGQLEGIARELERLGKTCGGRISYEVAELSVRDDLLGLGFDITRGEGEEASVLTAGERFRSVLRRGIVPVDTQVRYSSDERIGDLIANRQVLSASFPIRLSDFANLPLACNAKIASIDVELVGEGLGKGRPTVTLLYDGTSQLRSCQPDIGAIVGALETGMTSFGEITDLRTDGRSASLVASIGSFGAEGTANQTFEGMPLATTFTVLIDPATGENRRIDWNALEDVRLKLTYAYQDVFPVGQCK